MVAFVPFEVGTLPEAALRYQTFGALYLSRTSPSTNVLSAFARVQFP